MVRTSPLLAIAGLIAALSAASVASPLDDAPQQAKSQIQSRYDAGQGKIAILHWPSVWAVDSHSFRYSKTVQAVTLTGDLAQVTVYQDDSVAAVDPKSGARHVIRDMETSRDSWKHTPRGWFLKKSVPVSWQDTIDRARLMNEN